MHTLLIDMYMYIYMLIPIIRSTSCNLLHGTPVIRTVTTTNSTRCLWAAEHKTQPAPHWGPHASAKAIRPLVVETAGSSPGQSTPGSDPFSYSDCDTLRTTNNKRNKLLKIPKEDGNRTPCEHRPNGVRLQVLQPRLLWDFRSFCRAKKIKLKTIKSIQLVASWLVCALQLRLRAAKKDESVKRGPFATAAEAAMMAILETTWNKMKWLFCPPLQCSFVQFCVCRSLLILMILLPVPVLHVHPSSAPLTPRPGTL